MRLFYLLFSVLCLVTHLSAQKENYIWPNGHDSFSSNPIFGGINIDFNSGAVRAFGAIELGLHKVFKISIQDSIDLMAQQNCLVELGDMVAAMDSLFQDTTLRQADILGIIASQASLFRRLDACFSGHHDLLDTIVAKRISFRRKLLNENDLLTDTTLYQSNSKTAYSLFTERFMEYDVVLDSMQILTLAGIAGQCPLAGGEAVLMARAMLDAVLKTPVLYNDALLCEQSEIEGRKANIDAANTDFSISPNPASGHILLSRNSWNTTATHFILRNMIGQEVLNIALAQEELSQNIVTSQLKQGAYIWEVWAGSIRQQSGKVVLIK